MYNIITAGEKSFIGYALPAFCFDGEISPAIAVEEHSLTVSYEGWICRYTTNGTILDLNTVAANRNGHYRAFVVSAQNSLNVKIGIENKYKHVKLDRIFAGIQN